MNYEPGWYPQEDGQQRYWDGQQWTEHVAPVATLEPTQNAGPFIGQNVTVADPMSGQTYTSAGPITGQPYSGEELAEARSQAMRTLFGGLALFALGAVITGVTYSFAEEGGTFSVFYGLFIIGVIQAARGLFYLANPARLLK
jgi:hypothetical protein